MDPSSSVLIIYTLSLSVFFSLIHICHISVSALMKYSRMLKALGKELEAHQRHVNEKQEKELELLDSSLALSLRIGVTLKRFTSPARSLVSPIMLCLHSLCYRNVRRIKLGN